MWKPMLAGKVSDVNALRYPVLASQKLDGVRATVQGGRLMSRSLKPIPNCYVQEMFSWLPEGIDGELILGDPTAKDAYRKTVSVVMSDDKPADDVRLHVFDMFGPAGFRARLAGALFVARNPMPGQGEVVAVLHTLVYCVEELIALEAKWLAEGHEGVMIRSLDGPYKQGRSSEREGYLLKLKQFVDSEAVVISAYELEHNENEAKTNALGRTERSTAKAGKVLSGLMGGLNVRDLTTGVEFSIGTGFDAEDRKTMWEQRDSLPGQIVKYKAFPIGGKDKPRHPVWLGMRSKEDM
jgi:DNA ligase-1